MNVTANEGLYRNPVVVQAPLATSANNNVSLTKRKKKQKNIISSVSLIPRLSD